jgi:hypothetical protein
VSFKLAPYFIFLKWSFDISKNLYDFIHKIDEFIKSRIHSRLAGFGVSYFVFSMLDMMAYMLLQIRDG